MVWEEGEKNGTRTARMRKRDCDFKVGASCPVLDTGTSQNTVGGF